MLQNAQAIKKLFPIFEQHPTLVYLDNAATSQKPAVVIDTISTHYRNANANVHRGVYHLGQLATEAYEGARKKIADFLGAQSPQEVIFTTGTTEAINLVARTWGDQNVGQDDEIIIGISDHHSNIVPWQQLQQRVGCRLKFIPLTATGRLDMTAAEQLVTKKTKLLTTAHVSNVTGVIQPVAELRQLAEHVGAKILVDGAQSCPHISINVHNLGVDFYTMSGHKACGPTASGILYGRKDILAAMPPYQGGGEMITSVSTDQVTFAEPPHRFEAGTPPIAEAIGLGAAVEFLNSIDRKMALEHERRCGQYFLDELRRNPNVTVPYDPEPNNWIGIVTFSHKSCHPHDLAQFADQSNICIRGGHHCAQPLMQSWQLPATNRVSPFVYNSLDDMDKMLAAVEKAERILG